MGDCRLRQPANFLNIPPKLIQHRGVCQRDGLSEWVGEFAGQVQRLLAPCTSLIWVARLPEKMGCPDVGKQSKVGAEASDEGSALTRMVEDIGLSEVLCGG